MQSLRRGKSQSIFSLLRVNYVRSEIFKLSSVQSIKPQHHKLFNRIWIPKRFISRLNFKKKKKKKAILAFLHPGLVLCGKRCQNANTYGQGHFSWLRNTCFFLFFLETDMPILELSVPKLTPFKFKYWKNFLQKWGLYLPSLHQELFQTSGQQIYVFCIDFPLLAPANKAAKPRES